MGQRKVVKPSCPVTAKRPPSDTTPTSTPRKRPCGSLSQRSLTTPSFSNQIAPPAIPTPEAPTCPQQMTASRQESNKTIARVATSKLPQPTLTSTPFLANRLAFMNRDLMMKARTIKMGAQRAKDIQSGPLPRNGDRSRPNMPANSGESADLPSSMMTSSRPLSYTTPNGHKIPSRSVPILAAGTYIPQSGKTTLMTSRSQLPTQEQPYTPHSSGGSLVPHGHRLPAEVPPKSMQRTGDVVTADVPIINNDGTPLRNAVRTSRPTDQGGMRPETVTTKIPRNRRRPIVVNDEENSDNKEVLIQLPSASQHPTGKHHLTPISSPSPQSLAQQASERVVPPELEGVRSAMGNHDWGTYVGLMESVINKMITKREFEIMARRIFQMENKKMEKKVYKMTYRMVRRINT